MYRWTVRFLWLLLLVPTMPPLTAAKAQNTLPTVTKEQIAALVQAIQDEIYDYGYEAEYENLTSAPGEAKVPIYVNPHLIQPAVGEVIYKLMPYGEIERIFELGKNGFVVLDGDPENGFPPNGGPSIKTVYLSDRYVTGAKLTWVKCHITVLFNPSTATLLQAAGRQKERVGFSDYEYRLKHGMAKGASPHPVR